MSEDADKTRPAPTAAELRAERLAAELRANLRRRKEQARGRRDAVGDATGNDAPDAD